MQQLKEILEFVVEHFNIISSWKFIVFSGISLICTFICDKLYIMNTSFNELIKWGLLIITICTINKLAFQGINYIDQKRRFRIAYKTQLEQEQTALDNIKTLSRAELAIIKLIYYNPAKIAYIPIDRIDVMLLLHKKYIEQVNIADPNSYLVGGIHSNDWYLKKRNAFYTITKQTLSLMYKHDDEIKTLLKKIHINKQLRKSSNQILTY